MVDERCSPAESIAASLCWLARFQHGDLAKSVGGDIGAAINKGVGYWHRAGCRFCAKPMEELLTKYGTGNIAPGAMGEFMALERKARAARIREAQEVPWYEQLR